MAPTRLAAAAIRWISSTSEEGLIGVSKYTIFVFELIAAAVPSAVLRSARLTLTPNLGKPSSISAPAVL
ncbi:hypothetical protein D3C86_1125120 [compost metagenome]